MSLWEQVGRCVCYYIYISLITESGNGVSVSVSVSDASDILVNYLSSLFIL